MRGEPGGLLFQNVEKLIGENSRPRLPQGLCWPAPRRSHQFRVLPRAGALRQHESVLQPDARVVTASGCQFDERLKRGLNSVQKPLNLHASQMCLDAVEPGVKIARFLSGFEEEPKATLA